MRCHRGALFIAAVVVALLAAFAAPAAQARPNGPGRGDLELSAATVTPTGRVAADKAPTSRLAQTDRELERRTDDTPVRVIIKFDYDSTATYAGGVGKLAATSPSVTGRPLTGRTAAERAYGAYIDRLERGLKADIRRAVPDVTFGRSLRTVYGGVSAVLPASRVKDVVAIDGVVAVQKNALRQPLTDSSPEFVNAPPVYDVLGSTANAGERVIFGDLDTGLWPEHPAFADQGNLRAPPGPARECNYGDNPVTPAVDVFACQHKLIGGAHMTDDYDADLAPRPIRTPGPPGTADGHGTHTSSTSAGNIVKHAMVLGVDRGAIHGMAPGAWVMEYKVCGPDGCYTSDSAAAVAQAIIDGVDVINFSISGGTTPFSDPGELAFLDAYAAGVFVSASAGNDGPGAGTVNHLSPWVTSVAASTQAREFRSTLSLTAGDGDTFTARGATITDGAGPARVMLAEDVPNYSGGALCAEQAEPGDFVVNGRPIIVACQRGVQARVWKSFVAFTGGAAGMILYNPVLADTETDNHWLPTVHLADGTALQGLHGRRTFASAARSRGASPGRARATSWRRFPRAGRAGCSSSPTSRRPGCRSSPGRLRHRRRPTRSTAEARRESLPGHRRHVDVLSARRRRGHSRPCCAPGLDAGADQVRADDDGGHQRRQGGHRHAGRSVRPRCRAHRCRQVDLRATPVRRDGQGLHSVRQRPGDRSAPQPALDQRARHARPARDRPNGDQRQRAAGARDGVNGRPRREEHDHRFAAQLRTPAGSLDRATHHDRIRRSGRTAAVRHDPAEDRSSAAAPARGVHPHAG